MVSSTWYSGNDMDMLLPSCFFRMGAAAMLLSSCKLDRWRSKYEIKRLVRTHQGVDNRSFKSMHLKEDAEARQGLSVSKDLVETGGHALKANITTLGPLVLPVSEQIHFFTNLLFKKKNQALHSCKEPPKSSYQQHNHDPCSPPFPVPSNPKFHTLCLLLHDCNDSPKSAILNLPCKYQHSNNTTTTL